MQFSDSKLQKLLIFKLFLLFDYLWAQQRVWYLFSNGFIYDLAQVLLELSTDIVV